MVSAKKRAAAKKEAAASVKAAAVAALKARRRKANKSGLSSSLGMGVAVAAAIGIILAIFVVGFMDAVADGESSPPANMDCDDWKSCVAWLRKLNQGGDRMYLDLIERDAAPGMTWNDQVAMIKQETRTRGWTFKPDLNNLDPWIVSLSGTRNLPYTIAHAVRQEVGEAAFRQHIDSLTIHVVGYQEQPYGYGEKIPSEDEQVEAEIHYLRQMLGNVGIIDLHLIGPQVNTKQFPDVHEFAPNVRASGILRLHRHLGFYHDVAPTIPTAPTIVIAENPGGADGFTGTDGICRTMWNGGQHKYYDHDISLSDATWQGNMQRKKSARPAWCTWKPTFEYLAHKNIPTYITPIHKHEHVILKENLKSAPICARVHREGGRNPFANRMKRFAIDLSQEGALNKDQQLFWYRFWFEDIKTEEDRNKAERKEFRGRLFRAASQFIFGFRGRTANCLHHTAKLTTIIGYGEDNWDVMQVGANTDRSFSRVSFGDVVARLADHLIVKIKEEQRRHAAAAAAS